MLSTVILFFSDSDTNSHNDEQRSSTSTNSPIVITRAVINIKANGEAEAPHNPSSRLLGMVSNKMSIFSSNNFWSKIL